MISGVNTVIIAHAIPEDINSIKDIADAHRNELGFSRRPTLLKAINQQELLVAKQNSQTVGYVEYHHRRDNQTTLYNIVVSPEFRSQGIGRGLIQELQAEARLKNKQYILLKCPVELPANDFYQRIGFTLIKTEAGKHRPLNIWQWELSTF